MAEYLMETAWSPVWVKTGAPLWQNSYFALMETAWGPVSVKTGDPLWQNTSCALMETVGGLVSIKTGTLCGRILNGNSLEPCFG